MTNFKTPLRGQQELTLVGSEKTTSSLVVFICILTQVGLLQQECGKAAYFIASSIATATATVAPTIGLLPMPT